MSSLKLGLTVVAVLFLSACSHDEKELAPASTFEFSGIYSEQVYDVLLAEYYYHQQDYKPASHTYSKLLLTRADVSVAKRATELAIKVDDYDQALIAAQQWKALEPSSAEVNQFLVLLYQEKKDYIAAAKVLSELVKSYPLGEAKSLDVAVALLEQQKESENAYHTFKHYSQNHVGSVDKGENSSDSGASTYYLGLFAMRAQLFDEAINTTASFSEIEDKELQRKTALLRVKAYTALDKPEQALKALKKLIAEAADPVTKQAYARLMASLGQSDKAVALLEQAYDKHLDKAELLLDMISISLGDDKYEKTLLYIDRLQAIKGHETKAHYYRGLVYESQSKFSEALQQYQLIDEAQQSIQIHTRIATVLVEVKGLDDALPYLHKVQQRYKETELQGELYHLESEMLRRHEKYTQALEVNKKAAELSPLDLDILYTQALLYEDVNQIKKSEETLQEILHLDGNHSAALNALGYMLSVHTTRFDEAYKYIKKAYELRPNDPAIIDSLGWISYRKGDLQGAERYLRIAYQKLQDPEVASHLVEVLSKQGQQKEAAKLLKEMLEKHPKNKLLIETQVFINE